MNFAPVVDHGAVLAQGMAIVPDQAAIEARNQQLQMQAQAMQMQQAQMQQAIAQQRQQQERAAAWQQRVQGLLANPTPQAIRAALLEFPEQREALTSALGNPNDEAVQGSLRQMTSIYGALESGDPARAATLVEQRIAADAAAGQQPDEEDASILTALRSNDPAQINRVRGMIGMTLAAMPGADDFFQNIQRINPREERTPIWRAGQDAYDDAIRRGATPQQATERRNSVIDAMERNATDPFVTPMPGAVVGRQSDIIRQYGGAPADQGGGGQASGGNPRTAVLESAREAIRQGANPEAVIQRLQGMGYTEADLTTAITGSRGNRISAADASTMVRSMGRAAFDSWRQRNNVAVGQ